MKLIKHSILIPLLVAQTSLSSIPVNAEASNQDIVVDTIEVEAGSDVDVPNPLNPKNSFLEKTLDLYIKGQEYLKTAKKIR